MPPSSRSSTPLAGALAPSVSVGSSITGASAALLLAFPRLLSANLSWTALSHHPSTPPSPPCTSPTAPSLPLASLSPPPHPLPLPHLLLFSLLPLPSSPPRVLTHHDLCHSRGATLPPPPHRTSLHRTPLLLHALTPRPAASCGYKQQYPSHTSTSPLLLSLTPLLILPFTNANPPLPPRTSLSRTTALSFPN
ncbi:unnamed protein product [Closterium sp. NIES-64]|nr:unnamed protein product [Closterium sp. NIES-64]